MARKRKQGKATRNRGNQLKRIKGEDFTSRQSAFLYMQLHDQL